MDQRSNGTTDHDRSKSDVRQAGPRTDPGKGAATFLHVGAGICNALDSYLAADPAHVVLVEPDPITAAELRDRILSLPVDAQDRITLVESAIGPSGGTARLHVFNFGDVSSLNTPTGVYQIYPGLREIAQPEVATMTPADLIGLLDLAPGAAHHLIVDAPGQEAFLLKALAALDVLSRFRTVVLHCGTDALFEGAVPAQALLQWLEDYGYAARPVATLETDPDWCHRVLDLNPLALELRAVTAARSALGEQLTALEAELAARDLAQAELAAALEAAQVARDSHARTAETAEASNVALADELAELSRAREADLAQAEQAAAAHKAGTERSEQLSKERDALKAQVTDLTAKLSDVSAARTAAAARIETLTGQLSGAEAKLAETVAARDAGTERSEQLSKERDALKAELAETTKVSHATQSERDALRKDLEQARAALKAAEERQGQLAQSRDDIVRAEGQIALIKDLLLSGPEL